jgi:SAM-dependent methyltransferase
MDVRARDAFAERLFTATVGALDLLHVYVGDRLSLYKTMASGEAFTASRLAEVASISERYAREWLEHEAVAGVLTVSSNGDEERRFTLPEEHAEVLSDETSPSYLAPAALGVVGLARTLPLVIEAFRTGGGVPYEAFGADLRDAISRGNRPMFVNLLGSEWFPQVPGLVDRLVADPSARVIDVGCGVGWSSIAIAQAFPKATVTAVDIDDASIAEARANAREAGVDGRVTFEVRDAADPALSGRFDLVCAFETIHDMADPVSALRTLRSLRGESGIVLVADERVADVFTTDVDDGERFQWGWSALHCLPVSMADPPAAGTGTVMRTPTLRRYAHEAGFTDVKVLPVENMLWRFYQLVTAEG